MNKKIIIINIIILALLAGFIVISLVFYYLIPIGKNIFECIEQALNDLIGIIRR